MIGIVSYYPSDKKLKSIRKKNHKEQLKWLINLFPKETINIVSQNYKENDFVKYDKINYIKFDKPIGVSQARNVLFNLFYNSNDDVLFIMDDDLLMYDYYDTKTLLKDFYYDYDKYNKLGIDLIVPLSPNMKPFKKTIFEKSDFENEYLFKKININCCPNMMMIKNINKYHNIKIFNEDYDKNDKEAIFEDQKFLSEFMINNFRGYEVFNWVKKSLDIDVCSIIETTDSETSRKWHKALAGNFGNYLNSRYNLTGGVKEFNKIYNKAKDTLKVKRTRHYYITSNLIPKNSEEVKKWLVDRNLK